MFMTILGLLASYLLGSITAGLFIGKIFYKTDIRHHGSKSTGTTNAWRVLGAKAGIATFLFDFFKGAGAYWLGMAIDGPVHPFFFGLAAIIGHVYPIFANFKGGKAVATAAGVALAYNPWFLLFNFPLVFFIVLFLTSTVSIASITAITTAVILALVIKDFFLFFVALALWIFIIYRHKDNLKRIFKGEENTINWGLRKHTYKK